MNHPDDHDPASARPAPLSHGDALREAAVARARGLHDKAVTHAADVAARLHDPPAAASSAPAPVASPTPATAVAPVAPVAPEAPAQDAPAPVASRVETATSE